MTVLVTGGAGYIGSHTVRALRAGGERVVVLDSLVRGNRRAIGDTPLVVGDVGDRAVVDACLAEHAVESVIHFAALKAPGESMADPGRYFRENVGNSLVLIEAMARAGVQRIVFSSSCSVYGNPTLLPVTEAAPLAPESPYAESKRMVEDLLRWYDRCHGVRSMALRYFNAAGASSDGAIGEDWSQTANLLPLVMRAALGKSGPLRLFGTDYPTPDGTAIRDYVHVEDLADAHVRALGWLRGGGASGVLNLGTGHGASVQEVIDLVATLSGRPVPVERTDRRPGDPAAIWANPARAEAILGWRPRHDIASIVRTAWAWHAAHPDGPPTDPDPALAPPAGAAAPSPPLPPSAPGLPVA